MSDHEVDRLHGLIHWVQRPGVSQRVALARGPFQIAGQVMEQRAHVVHELQQCGVLAGGPLQSRHLSVEVLCYLHHVSHVGECRIVMPQGGDGRDVRVSWRQHRHSNHNVQVFGNRIVEHCVDGIKLAPASAALPFGPMATVRRGFLAADHAELCRAEVAFHGIAAASQRNLDQASKVRAFLPHNSSGRGIERRS
jgi:hypothetical protein